LDNGVCQRLLVRSSSLLGCFYWQPLAFRISLQESAGQDHKPKLVLFFGFSSERRNDSQP
jgi:hypothetical protein